MGVKDYLDNLDYEPTEKDELNYHLILEEYKT